MRVKRRILGMAMTHFHARERVGKPVFVGRSLSTDADDADIAHPRLPRESFVLPASKLGK